MNAILEQINSSGKIFVEFALPMLVQSSVLILILLLTDFALRKKLRAVFRYWIWLLVLLKLLLPTSLSSPLSLGYFFGDELAYVDIAQITEEPQVTVVDPTPASVPPFIDLTNIKTYRHTPTVPPIIPDTGSAVTEPIKPPVVSVTPVTWQGIVFLLWLAVVMAMGLLLLQRANFVRGLVAQSKEANGVMKDTFVHCCERMGVKRKLGLKVSANATSPAVCGLFRPVILVPQNLTSNLSANQLQAVLLHELAHIRRSDLWVNLAQTILQIIYFYNPLLWLANCVIRRVREQAVDEMVLVAMGEKARQYPQTLVNVAKMAFKRPALSLRLIGVVESKSALAGRIKHILNRPMPKRAKLGILGLAVVIITAAILLPMATCTPGPPSLVIKGMVKDAQTGEPIAGARIFDDGYGPEPDWEQIKADVRSEWGAITNSAGEYSFLTWPEHHSIKIEAPGYKAERRSLYSGHFVFNKKDEETFDFILEPEKATDSSEFKTKLPNGVTAELPMARAQKPEFAGRGGPLDIRLAGVRPDGSDDIYDGNGNKIADNTFANIAMRWREDSQHRTFIFELPKAEEPILFSPFLKIKPTGAKQGFGPAQHRLLYYSGDKLTYSVGMNFPRTYKKVFERRVNKVDLTLRYYYGRRRAADFVFKGPFTPGQTIKAEGGADCELTAMKDRLDFSHYPAAFFRISSKTRFDSDSVLVYDISGRRYLPESEGGRSGSDGSEYRFRAEGLTLSSIAYVTVGEKPYEATFKNVVVSYSDRPVRDRMEFLDEMCERLDLTGLSGEDLYKYKFENPADAIKVINIVRGRRYVMQVFNAIRWAQPKVELSSLDEQTQEEIRSVAAKWAKAGHPNIRAMGIRLGLMGGWPEFMDLALEWLEQDVTVYDMVGRAYRGLEGGAKADIAGEVARFPAGLKSEQAERIKRIILRTDNPHLRVRLFQLFWRADKDLTFQTCRDLVQDNRPWIWWPAMRSLSNRCTEKLRPFGNLPEKIQKRLILVHEAGGSSRLFGVSSSGRDYDTVAKEAYSMLPAMFTANLARMDSSVCSGVRTVMIKHLDREIAAKAMTDFLREISAEPNQRLWAGNSYYFHTCCVTAYYIARHINSLYDVNIANLGEFETREDSDAVPYNISRLKQLIAATLQWYDSRSGTDNESGRATEVGAGNKAGQSPFAATLPNGVTVELVGVCDIPADGKHWWAADGSPLENVFWDGTTNKEDAEDARQMVFRVRSNDSGPDLAPTASFQVHRQQQPPGSWSGAFFVSKDNQTLEELRGCSFSLHDDHPTVDISATVGYDPWETQARRSVNSDGNLTSTLTKIGILILNDPTEKNGKTTISATLLDQVKAWRFIAIDKQGKFHNSSSAFANGWDEDDENNIARHQIFKAEFMLPLSQIDKFQFQTRQVETITFKNVSLKPNFKTDVQVEEESFSDFQVSDESKKFGAVDFEGYFVNSAAGGLTLDQLWDDKNKDLRDADEILEIIRKGLRRYSGSGNILRWIGNLFIWGKNPQNEKAIELMYHASGSPNRGLYGDAIYFGLSVTKNKTPEILQAMVAVAMKTDDYYNVTGRILWGCRNQKDELIACLDPYLNSDDISIRQKAQDVKNYFMDSKAFMAKRAKEHEESVQQEYGNKLGQFKDKLLKGDSQTRLDTLKQLSNKGIMSIVDVSFLDVFQACIKDSDPEVRTTAARIMGSKFIWSGEPQNTQAIEILAELLEDPDRSTRGAAVYYGLSTVRNPSKELIRKMLITILDDREINYYGRVIWGIRRNKQACVEILKEWMNQSEQDNQRAVKAYEIYEDVSAQQLPDEYAQRFAGQKSNAYEGLVAMCFHAKPVSKEKLQKQFLEHLANGSLMQKVLDFYIIETRETAVGMFTCDNLADRNAIRDALTKDKVFQVAGYMHGKIGPTGSGWVDSLQKFRKRNELNRVSLPKPDVQVETEKPQSLIFHGLDLTAVPHTTNSSRLPDLFEERPLGSKSYHIQKDVTAIYSGLDGTVYFIPGRNIFYVQHDKLGSSTLTYYGPFEGNPVQVLNLQSDVQAEVERSDKSSESKSSRQAVEKLPEMRGRVYGVVVNSVTGEPIAGAYVGVGDFGDSGGSNYSRHRQQGLYAKAQTDEEGRFVLEGVAFRDDHPLVVTHPEFVRHDMKVAVQRGGPEPEIKVSLRPAAKINVTVVDSNGKPLEGFWLVRLEALDGRYFIPPGRDRHLSSFASSVWMELPKPKLKPDKKSLSGTTGFSFTELDSGEYSIDVIKFTITDNYTPPPAGIVRLPLDTSNITYYGGIANLKIEDGQTKEVVIKPANYQTSITIKMPDDPVKKPNIPPFVVISRNVGLLLWNDGKAHGPEDHRLGRLQKNALYYNMVVDGDVLTIKNLPPGSYSVFAGPIYFMNAVRMKVLSGREVTVEIPVIRLSEHAKVGLWTFDRKVKPEAGSYSVSDLCELISAKTGSNPRIIAEASIQNEKLKLSEREMSVWDLLETLYLEKGWKLKEGAKKTLVLYPAAKADVQAERETNNRAELNAAPVEIQAIGKVLKEWFENCAAGDLEEVKKAYLPSLNKKAERDLQQIERFLEVVPDWQFSLLGVMWDGNKATAVSNVLKGLKDPAAIISGPVVWICHLNKLDGQWRLANNVVGERMEIVQTFITQAKQKNPNLRIWPENFSTHLFQETNVLKKEAKVFEEGHWEQLDGAPKEVQDIGEVLRRWFGGCLAGDLEQVKATYTPNNRKRAEKQLKEIREYMTIMPADWQFSPMIIKIGDSRAEAISHEFVITFNHPENTGDPAVLIVHLMKVDAQWGILYSSGDLLRNVSYAHFKRKYPQSRIWFDKSIPDWLKPDQETNTDITIGDIKSGLPETKTEETLAEKLRELNNDKTVFESYFPDSVEGGKALDDWWQRRSKDPDIDNKIFSMVRYGLRMDGKGNPRKYNKDLYIKWIGQKYIWKKGPKNKQAVELMYYASFDPGLTGDVVYNGLSVAGPEQNPKILKRLVDICMIDTSVTRILWGTKGKHDRMIEYLEPYLNSLDQQIRQRAVILEKAFKGEIDYGQWEKEQYRKKRQEEFGDQLSQIREVLLKGNSKQRSEMFDLIKRKGLYILVDDSFKEPLIACLKDDHPVVKEAALRLSGGVLLKKNEQSPDIFELMSNLSNDWDHKVRNEAAKFIGSHWIWGVKPQKPEAIEIMLRLSKDKDRGVRYQAVYYGLSVVENKDERIVKRLVEMALDKTNDFGRISWGLSRGADKKMIKKQLKPYLGLESKKSELARQLYKEIFKEELPEI